MEKNLHSERKVILIINEHERLLVERAKQNH